MPDLIRHPVVLEVMDSGSSLHYARNDGVAFLLLGVTEQRRKITVRSSEELVIFGVAQGIGTTVASCFCDN